MEFIANSSMKESKNLLFGTDGIRGTINLYPMLPEICLKVGMAL